MPFGEWPGFPEISKGKQIPFAVGLLWAGAGRIGNRTGVDVIKSMLKRGGRGYGKSEH